MRIQEAVKVCHQKPNLFGRPTSWKGNGQAVDLARRLRADKVSRVTAIHGEAAWERDWDVSPEDLLDDWEVLSLSALAKEFFEPGSEEDEKEV